MDDEPQVVPLDLTIGQKYKEVQEYIIYKESGTITEQELDSVDRSHTEIPAKFVGSPDCITCNNTRYFESIIANIEKKIDGLKNYKKKMQDPVDNIPAPEPFTFSSSLEGPRDMQERLFYEFQARSYGESQESCQDYRTTETRHSETIKIYDLGNVNNKQMLVDVHENAKQNLNEIQRERHITSTITQPNLQGQYLAPQLHINPTVLEKPSKHIPIVTCNENGATSTNVERNAYDNYLLNNNRIPTHSNIQMSDFNGQYAGGNVLPKEQNYWQSGFSTDELNELLLEIENIESYVTTMDKDAGNQAFNMERFCPEYWALLTNKLIKIKTQLYLLNGFNDTFCDKILSRVNTLGKFPQEYWYPVPGPVQEVVHGPVHEPLHGPPIVEGCSRYIPQEKDKPKIILKLARNIKKKVSDPRKYNRGRGGRQRRKNSVGSWSVMRTETSDQLQNPVQATEVSRAHR